MTSISSSITTAPTLTPAQQQLLQQQQLAAANGQVPGAPGAAGGAPPAGGGGKGGGGGQIEQEIQDLQNQAAAAGVDIGSPPGKPTSKAAAETAKAQLDKWLSTGAAKIAAASAQKQSGGAQNAQQNLLNQNQQGATLGSFAANQQAQQSPSLMGGLALTA